MSATIHELIASGRRRLADAGVRREEATLDARLLAQHVMGWTAADLLASGLDAPPVEAQATYARLIDRRAAREPLAYILGTKEFWGLPFEVTRDVLVPRPETELLVEVALEHLQPSTTDTIADVCTGSGAVAIALAHARPRLSVLATDISEPALKVAARNAARHGVDSRIRFVRTDIMSGVTEQYPLIVANPPYIPTGDRQQLQSEVRDHEPALALFGGSEGLDVIASLVAHASVRLRPAGRLIFECGAGQAAAIRRLMAETPLLRIVEIRPDLQRIPRVVIAQLAPATESKGH